MEKWTIQKLLDWVVKYFERKATDAPRLSAELLLGAVLGMKRIELYTNFDKVVEKTYLDKLHELVRRAADKEPLAYLIGKTEFYSLEFKITPDCLIPRPETELLVERSIDFLRKRTGPQLVCDLCTGSGCIAIAITKNVPDSYITATDISDSALKVAEQNIENHKLQQRIKLFCGNLFDPIVPQMDESKFDLIVCNPPYVSSTEYQNLDINVSHYEPKLALYAGKDGLDIYRRIIEKVGDFLKNDGALILEIGYSQGSAVRELLQQLSIFKEIKLEKDYQNNDRVVIAVSA